MTFSLEDERNLPGAEFAHFTNRVDELAALRRVLALPSDEPLPMLLCYGVGGAGKTCAVLE